MDPLGRFYTDTVVSTLLINSLETEAPANIIDLGIGDASLTKAAFSRWSGAQYYATDIEQHKVKSIQKSLSYVNVKRYDSLRINVGAKLNIKLGSIDVAICNPPYVKIEKSKKYKKLFTDNGLGRCMSLRQISSELVFFAHNISLLKDDGEMGIIISDSLITCKEYKIFREALLSQFELKSIIQLPDKIFSKTEARTYILLLNKRRPVHDTCKIMLANSEGAFSETLCIAKSKLTERMDYTYWKYAQDQNTCATTLKGLGAEIKRGHYDYKDLREKAFPYFHSNSLSQEPKSIGFNKKTPKELSTYAARKGDILMCRVGKRCVGRLAKVTRGTIITSSCVYTIRVPKEFQDLVWQSLTSEAGTNWINANAHGVCAQVISKCDLENFPIQY